MASATTINPPKSIDREGLGESRTGISQDTRQKENDDNMKVFPRARTFLFYIIPSLDLAHTRCLNEVLFARFFYLFPQYK